MDLIEKEMPTDNISPKNVKMMKRIRWDSEEAVALFSLYIKENGKVSMESVVAFF